MVFILGVVPAGLVSIGPVAPTSFSSTVTVLQQLKLMSMDGGLAKARGSHADPLYSVECGGPRCPHSLLYVTVCLSSCVGGGSMNAGEGGKEGVLLERCFGIHHGGR
jgi:hypothetical protein